MKSNSVSILSASLAQQGRLLINVETGANVGF